MQRDSRMEESNYWQDRRVRVSASAHHAWRVVERREVVILPMPDDHEHATGEEQDACASCQAEAAKGDGSDEGEGQRDHAGPGEVELPFRFVACEVCRGKGTHVNPSIDASGLTREDFDEDPDFAEDYMSGLYDVQCGECRGARVVPEIYARTDADKEVIRALDVQAEADASYERDCRAERAMGY